MQSSARIDELRQKFHENPRRYFAPLANEYRKAGDPEQAIAICRAHLAQQPAHMSGHVVYAQSLYDAGRIEESRVVFEKALSLDPDNAIVLRQLGDISRQRGDSSEARHWYSRALEADPHDREIAAYIAELTEPLTEPDASADKLPGVPESGGTAASETPTDAPIAEQPAEAAIAEQQAEVTPLAWELADEARDDEPGLPTPATDVEVSPAEPALEPEVVERPDEGVTESDDVDAVTSSVTAASPFVTRTMADLYARQGYHQQALEVYRELAAANPDDAELSDRIRELSSLSETPISPLDLEDPASTEEKSSEAAAPTSEAEDELAEPEDLESDRAMQPQQEAPVSPPDLDVPAESHHFTEAELAEGDQWDTDPWGAGFSSDDGDVVPFDFSPSNSSPEWSDANQIENPPGLEDAGNSVAEPAEADQELSEASEPVASHSTADEAEAPEVGSATAPEAVAEPELSAPSVPLGVPNEAREEIPSEEIFAVPTASPVPYEEETTASTDDAVVAYSPQTPDEKDLAHYKPTGPTIREFFATLGAHRPPADVHRSFTARAELQEIESAAPDESEADEIWSPAAAEPEPDGTAPEEQQADEIWSPAAAEPEADETTPEEPQADEIWSPAAPDESPVAAREPDAFPLASDAFASLFPDSPVSEEDSRAAFALSGALSSQPGAPRLTPPKPAAPTAADQPIPATGAPESEEDIRRFREWLDGLADS